MADIRFLVDDIDQTEEDQEDEGYEMEEDSSILDQITAEELLSAAVKMERFMHSDIVFNRQMAARYVQEALRTSRTKEEIHHILRLMVRLSDDIEPSVRVELMEQVPHVAVYCYEHHSLMDAIPQYILYIVLRYLTDTNNQVRKTSQAALLVLLEQEVVERADVEEQVCPVLLQLTSGDSSDDYRSEAVALMSKMAPLVGKDITEKYFLPRFEVLCSDPLFHVRKVCASNFGEICSVLGPEVTRDKMLPVFFRLCQDGVWGVRKACAECFMSVSAASAPEIRKKDLAHYFINLLSDKSRWVQMASYQSLGPFISTFASPVESGFYINDEGILCQVPGTHKPETPPTSPTQTEAEQTVEECTNTETSQHQSSQSEAPGEDKPERQPSPETNTTDSGYVSPPELPSEAEHKDGVAYEQSSVIGLEKSSCKDSKEQSSSEDKVLDSEIESSFNTFLYWRTPLLSLELDPELLDNPNEGGSFEKSDQLDLNNDRLDNLEHKEFCTEDTSDTACENESCTSLTDATHKPKLSFANDSDDSDEEDCHIPIYSLADDPGHYHVGYHGEWHSKNNFQDLKLGSSFEEDLLIPDHIQPLPPQHVVPQALLDHYLSMTEPAKAQTIDTEIARHCAFSFPAVALTLGRKNWACLRDTYELLASDMQWKVRRTLAFSIHELAQILGEDITRMELVPAFNSFLKDLDEVRIGVLKHLGDFIKLLPSDVKKDYLPVLVDFLTTDNNRNWRFRYELAEQLMMLSELYSPLEVLHYVCPIAITLATDRVADVRTISFKLIGVLLKKVHRCDDDTIARKFVSDIITKFANSQQWMRRQAYAQLCQSLLEEDAESGPQFASDFLPSLVTLLSDSVPNVRLNVARTMAQTVLLSDYFNKTDCQARDIVLSALGRLQTDPDRDVRYFAGRRDSFDISLQDSDSMEGTGESRCNTLQSDHDGKCNEDGAAAMKISPSETDTLVQPVATVVGHSESSNEEQRLVDLISKEVVWGQSACEHTDDSEAFSESVQHTVNGERASVALGSQEACEHSSASESENILNHFDGLESHQAIRNTSVVSHQTENQVEQRIENPVESSAIPVEPSTISVGASKTPLDPGAIPVVANAIPVGAISKPVGAIKGSEGVVSGQKPAYQSEASHRSENGCDALHLPSEEQDDVSEAQQVQ